MKILIFTLLLPIASAVGATNPFSPMRPDEHYGVGTATWRFASSLSKDATGTIEICYVEENLPASVLAQVAVRPFQSSESKSPDLRILIAKVVVESKKEVVLIIRYGIRSGTFVVDAPGLASQSWTVFGNPHADEGGEISLVRFGNGGGTFKPDGGTMTGFQGRLFIRYVE